MLITQVIDLAEVSFRLGKSLLLVGPPGIGKTFGLMQAADRLKMDFIGLCSPLEDPSTVRGYPSRGSDGIATHCLFDGIARAFNATKPTVLCWDDLGMASDSTLRSITRLIQFREIDGRKMPECVIQCAASNDITHSSGVSGIIEPIKNRFHSIINVETNVEAVVQWGLSRGWPDWLRAYLRNMPDAVHDWKPSKSLKNDGATPRTWEFVAEWDNAGMDNPEVWAGCVGPGRANQAHAFKQFCAALPDVDAILLDPEGASVPEAPDAKYFVCAGMASRINANTFGAAVTYLKKMPPMFRAFAVRDAFRAEKLRIESGKLPKNFRPLHTSGDFTSWMLSKDGQEIMTGV